jgi:hypothetical protein
VRKREAYGEKEEKEKKGGCLRVVSLIFLSIKH